MMGTPSRAVALRRARIVDRATRLAPALWSEERDFAGAVTGLAAGIMFVDLLAVADAPKANCGRVHCLVPGGPWAAGPGA